MKLCLGLPGEPCGRLVPAPASRCEEHKRAFQRLRDLERGSAAARGYDSAWRNLREQVLERDRWLCQVRLPGCTIEATTVDHIVPLARGGARLDPANCRAACRPCNSARAAAARSARCSPGAVDD